MFTTLSGKTLHQEEEEHGDIWVMLGLWIKESERKPGVKVRMFKMSLVEGGVVTVEGGVVTKESDLI